MKILKGFFVKEKEGSPQNIYPQTNDSLKYKIKEESQ
jgi:hypothetical protein